MSPSFDARRFAALDALLRQALDREDAEREAFLARIDREQPEVAPHLRAMIAAADAEGDVLSGLLDPRLWAMLADDRAAGQRFGPWRARGTLAHGGMARVLYAERADGSFEQGAAIKCLWSGLASEPLVARFEQERQILARLDDPRIARLIDGGVRADGVPWLALEYVSGSTIGVHCDRRRLDLDQRIALWHEVAAAVATAHRQLVVHRDLKPANVMVNDSGAVKLLDFGIAKLLEPEGFPNAAPATQLDGRALTLEYASPEQVRGDPVTTASDVFQLGLLLYELATGARPFRRVRGRPRSADDEVAAPSSAIQHDADAAAHAVLRATMPRRLVRRLRGDFDAIVLHALATSPAARYVSADALREDVIRWQHGLPVHARRSGPLRRSHKWLNRHRWFAAGVVAFVAIGAIYAITTLRQAHAIEREAAINRAVRDYLVGWFQAGDPGGTQGRDPTASDMLASGLAKARRELTAQPDLQAEILSIVGEVYVARGDYVRAEPVLREAYALYRDLPDTHTGHRGESANGLGMLLHYTARYAEAETLLREAVAEQTAALGENAFRTLAVRLQLADVLHSRGLYAEARAELEPAVAGARMDLGEEASLTANLERYLADVYRDSGRETQAEALYRHALRTQLSAHGEIHPNTAATRLSYGRLLLDEGRFDAAATQIEPGLAAYRQTQGGSMTPASAYWERNLAELEEARGDFVAAAERLDRLDAAMRAMLPPGHLILAYYALDAGYVALARGDVDGSQRQFASAERIFDAIQPQGHPRRIETRLGRALIARKKGDAVSAQRLLAAATVQAREQLAPGHPLFDALAVASASEPASAQAVGLAALRVQRALAAPPVRR